MTLKEVLEHAVAQLSPVHTSARLDAEVLLANVLGKPRHYAYTFAEQIVTPELERRYATLIERRVVGEPVAYLTGEREFWSLALEVTPDTLIPRPDTERVVEMALELIPVGSAWTIADLGTGSGAIAIALACERPECKMLATDCSEAAVEIAQKNARRHGLLHLEFCLSNWCDGLPSEFFDLVVSNPPYVKTDDFHLSCGDVRFEPRSALIAGDDGLNAHSTICQSVGRILKPRGYLLLEHGADQKEAVKHLMQGHGFQDIRHYKDYAGHDRVTRGRLTAS